MNKIVNIKAGYPVRTVRPMVYGNVFGVSMKVEDILKCICGKAIVDEVLKDGSLVRLNLKNYNIDNEPNVAPTVEKKVEAPAPKVKETKEDLQAKEVALDPVVVEDEVAVPDIQEETPVEVATNDETTEDVKPEPVAEKETPKKKNK